MSTLIFVLKGMAPSRRPLYDGWIEGSNAWRGDGTCALGGRFDGRLIRCFHEPEVGNGSAEYATTSPARQLPGVVIKSIATFSC